MSAIASHITSLTIAYSIVYSDADQRKHQSSASLAFVRGIHRGSVNSPHKMASCAENVSIWWRHHGNTISHILKNVPHVHLSMWYEDFGAQNKYISNGGSIAFHIIFHAWDTRSWRQSLHICKSFLSCIKDVSFDASFLMLSYLFFFICSLTYHGKFVIIISIYSWFSWIISIISLYISYTFYPRSHKSVSLIQTSEQSGEVSQKIEIVTAMSMRPQGRISAVWNNKHT